MNRRFHRRALFTALLVATSWPALGALAEAPASERGGDRAFDGRDGQKHETKGEFNPLQDERTKRFMRFGKIPARLRNDGAPKVGETAPPLKLKTLDGGKEVDLASFTGKRPVVLFFGSYT